MMRKSERGFFINLARASNRSLPWESGAEDARTPDASRPPGVSEPREASGVRPIYRRFPSGAGRPALLAAMHDSGSTRLSRNRTRNTLKTNDAIENGSRSQRMRKNERRFSMKASLL